MVGGKLDMSQQCALTAQKANHILGCGQQVQRSDPAPLLCTGEASPGVLCPDMEFLVQERYGHVEHVQRRATKMMQGMEHLPTRTG